MASIAFEEYKNKLNNLRPALDDLGGALHLDEARNEVEKLEEESAQDGFWNDTENSQRVQKRIKTLKHKLERYAKLTGAWEDMLTMCEMAVERRTTTRCCPTSRASSSPLRRRSNPCGSKRC